MFRGYNVYFESCCFIINGEFLFGLDDGCVVLWSILKKKLVYIVYGVYGSIEKYYLSLYID